MPYLPNWRGGSVRFNPSLTFLLYKVTFKPRPQEPKQCILRCENTSRCFTSCVMASSHRAPKQWCLSKVETINSFENLKQNLLYTLSLDSNFVPFLADGVQWLKKTKAQPLGGLEADGDSIPHARRLTARQKVNFLELMLGQISNYCPIISRSTLVKNSTSLEYIWQTIRQHFGFQATGAQFIDFSDIHLAADERPEDLYQRLMAFVADSLLRANGLTHHGEHVAEDEELTPTLENFVVLTWLRLIHPSLPRLVKQRYGTELRSRTLASIKPEISQALSSLLEEIRASDDAKILRAAVADDFRRPRPGGRSDPKTRTRHPRQDKVCPLCKQAGRSNTNHFLSQCTFLPDNDRRFMVKARQIVGILDDEQDTNYDLDPDPPCPETTLPTPDVVAYRVQTRQSPYMDVFHGHRVVRITIDSGATGNMIRHSTAKHLGCPIISSALLSFRWSERYGHPSPATTLTLHSRDLSSRILTSKCSAGPLSWRQTTLPSGPPSERCYLAMAPPTHTGPRPLPALPQPSAEPLFSVLLLPPRLFGPENSWKYSSQTMLPPIQSMHLNPALMHLVYVISSPLSCGRNPVSFPVLCGQSGYQTCQPNLERLSVTNTSARSPLSLNQKRSYRQASLLLSIRYLPLLLATLHPSR